MPYLDHLVTSRNQAALKKHAGSRQIIKGEKRKHVVKTVMDALKDWRSTPFENEGSCRAGLRSALCLEGYRWTLCDAEAEKLVSESLRHMGAKRPTWIEGQPEYLEPRENCGRCGVDLPEDLLRSGKRTMYCSEVCAKSALVFRCENFKSNQNKTYVAAHDALRRLRSKPIDCAVCGKSFRPRGTTEKLCSVECRAQGKVKVPTKACIQCGISFRPRMSVKMVEGGRGVFCGFKCKGIYQSARVFNRTCIFCSVDFVANSKVAKYCSSACTNAHFRTRNGNPPPTIKPHIFDFHAITLPRLRALTAENFDEVMAAA